MTPVPVADYVMVLCSFPDYNESILRFEEYLLKEGCYGMSTQMRILKQNSAHRSARCIPNWIRAICTRELK